MSETTESLDAPQVAETGSAATATKGRRRGPGLSGMVLADLKTLAGELGIKGTSAMRKGDLVAAISAKQGGAGAAAPAASSDTPANGARVSRRPASNVRGTRPGRVSATRMSNWRATSDLADWMERRGRIGIGGIALVVMGVRRSFRSKVAIPPGRLGRRRRAGRRRRGGHGRPAVRAP